MSPAVLWKYPEGRYLGTKTLQTNLCPDINPNTVIDFGLSHLKSSKPANNSEY